MVYASHCCTMYILCIYRVKFAFIAHEIFKFFQVLFVTVIASDLLVIHSEAKVNFIHIKINELSTPHYKQIILWNFNFYAFVI